MIVDGWSVYVLKLEDGKTISNSFHITSAQYRQAVFDVLTSEFQNCVKSIEELSAEVSQDEPE
jgi:hypothetical protein